MIFTKEISAQNSFQSTFGGIFAYEEKRSFQQASPEFQRIQNEFSKEITDAQAPQAKDFNNADIQKSIIDKRYPAADGIRRTIDNPERQNQINALKTLVQTNNTEFSDLKNALEAIKGEKLLNLDPKRNNEHRAFLAALVPQLPVVTQLRRRPKALAAMYLLGEHTNKNLGEPEDFELNIENLSPDEVVDMSPEVMRGIILVENTQYDTIRPFEVSHAGAIGALQLMPDKFIFDPLNTKDTDYNFLRFVLKKEGASNLAQLSDEELRSKKDEVNDYFAINPFNPNIALKRAYQYMQWEKSRNFPGKKFSELTRDQQGALLTKYHGGVAIDTKTGRFNIADVSKDYYNKVQGSLGSKSKILALKSSGILHAIASGKKPSVEQIKIFQQFSLEFQNQLTERVNSAESLTELKTKVAQLTDTNPNELRLIHFKLQKLFPKTLQPLPLSVTAPTDQHKKITKELKDLGFDPIIKDGVRFNAEPLFYGEHKIDDQKFSTLTQTLDTLKSTDAGNTVTLETPQLEELLVYLKENFNIDPKTVINNQGELPPVSAKSGNVFEQSVLAYSLLIKINPASFSPETQKLLLASKDIQNAQLAVHKETSEHLGQLKEDNEHLKDSTSLSQFFALLGLNKDTWSKEEMQKNLSRFLDENGNIKQEVLDALTIYQETLNNSEKTEKQVAELTAFETAKIDCFNSEQLIKISHNLGVLIQMLQNSEKANTQEVKDIITKLKARQTALAKITAERQNIEAANNKLGYLSSKADFTIEKLAAQMALNADQVGKEGMLTYIPAVVSEWWDNSTLDEVNSSEDFHKKTLVLLTKAGMFVRAQRDIANKAGVPFDTDTKLNEVSQVLWKEYDSYFVDQQKFERNIKPIIEKRLIKQGKTPEQASAETDSWYSGIVGKIKGGFISSVNALSSIFGGEDVMSQNKPGYENVQRGVQIKKDDFKSLMQAVISRQDATDRLSIALCEYGKNGSNPADIAALLAPTSTVSGAFTLTDLRAAQYLKQQISTEKGRSTAQAVLDGNIGDAFVSGINSQIDTAQSIFNGGHTAELQAAAKAYKENMQSGGVGQWWENLGGGMKLGIIALLATAAFKHSDVFGPVALATVAGMAVTQSSNPGELFDTLLNKVNGGMDSIGSAMGFTKESRWNDLKEELQPNPQESQAIMVAQVIDLEDLVSTLDSKKGSLDDLQSGKFPADALNDLLNKAKEKTGNGLPEVQLPALSIALYKLLMARCARERERTGSTASTVQEALTLMKGDLENYKKQSNGRTDVAVVSWIHSHITRYENTPDTAQKYGAFLLELGIDKGSELGEWLKENWEIVKDKTEKFVEKTGEIIWEGFKIEDPNNPGEYIWFYNTPKDPNGHVLDDISVAVAAGGKTVVYKKGKRFVEYTALEPLQDAMLYTGLETKKAWEPKEDFKFPEGSEKARMFKDVVSKINKTSFALDSALGFAEEDFDLGLPSLSGEHGNFQENRAQGLYLAARMGVLQDVYRAINAGKTVTFDADGKASNSVIENILKEYRAGTLKTIMLIADGAITTPSIINVASWFRSTNSSLSNQAQEFLKKFEAAKNNEDKKYDLIESYEDTLLHSSFLFDLVNIVPETNKQILDELARLGSQNESIDNATSNFSTKLSDAYIRNQTEPDRKYETPSLDTFTVDPFGQNETTSGGEIFGQAIFLYKEFLTSAIDPQTNQEQQGFEEYQLYLEAVMVKYFHEAAPFSRYTIDKLRNKVLEKFKPEVDYKQRAAVAMVTLAPRVTGQGAPIQQKQTARTAPTQQQKPAAQQQPTSTQQNTTATQTPKLQNNIGDNIDQHLDQYKKADELRVATQQFIEKHPDKIADVREHINNPKDPEGAKVLRALLADKSGWETLTQIILEPSVEYSQINQNAEYSVNFHEEKGNFRVVKDKIAKTLFSRIRRKGKTKTSLTHFNHGDMFMFDTK